MRKTIAMLIFSLSIFCYAEDVRILSLTGPLATVRIQPPSGSTVAYRMDMSGQKAICFQSASAVEVYLGTNTATLTSTGWGIYTKGDALCADLAGGTTVWFVGSGGVGDIRVLISK